MSSFVTIPSDFPRDVYKRPLIIPDGGGKSVAYRRMTSYIDVLADKFKLQQWDKRQVAIGLAQRADLRLSVLAHLGEKERLDNICKDAKEYALANAKATDGTSFHTLTDMVDNGAELPAGLPDNIVRTLDAFREATSVLKVVAIEPKTVLDPYKVAGTPDRIYEWQGTRYIGDTKTGTIRWGTQKIAAQLAGYSRSRLYDIKSGERIHHGADTGRGIIMDVDTEQCTVDLVWVDLEAGWRAVQVAATVWEQRSLDTYARLTRPWDDTDGFTDTEPKKSKRVASGSTGRTPAEQVAQASSRSELEALWGAYSRDGQWTDDLTAIAQRRTAELPTAS